MIRTILCSLMGLVFVVFGSNMFLHFIPNPPMPPAAGEFFGALFKPAGGDGRHDTFMASKPVVAVRRAIC